MHSFMFSNYADVQQIRQYKTRYITRLPETVEIRLFIVKTDDNSEINDLIIVLIINCQ